MHTIKDVDSIYIGKERYIEPYAGNECVTYRDMVIKCGNEILKIRFEIEDSCSYLPINIEVEQERESV